MPFGVKNARATFQRMVNEVFKELTGNIMEAYVDDMLVKSLDHANHVKHLDEAFALFRKFNMKLNPEKCIFGVTSGKFLRYLITQRGIKANLVQISVILEMKSPTTIKEVQILNGRLAALNCFLSRSIDKCKPFFLAIKKNGADFCWNNECEAAF